VSSENVSDLGIENENKSSLVENRRTRYSYRAELSASEIRSIASKATPSELDVFGVICTQTRMLDTSENDDYLIDWLSLYTGNWLSRARHSTTQISSNAITVRRPPTSIYLRLSQRWNGRKSIKLLHPRWPIKTYCTRTTINNPSSETLSVVVHVIEGRHSAFSKNYSGELVLKTRIFHEYCGMGN